MNPLSSGRTSSASPLTNTSPTAVSPVSNGSPLIPLSNSQIEAVIQMATSSANAAARDTRTQLFVGNLPYRVRWQDLKDLFRKAGTVLRADVSLGPDNRSRGHGTVLLATSEDAARAIEMFNGYNWQTRTLEVRPDRLPQDYDNPSNIPMMSNPNSIPPLSARPFSSPVHPIYGLPLGDRTLSYAGSEEFDPTKLFGERTRTGSNAGARSLFVGNLPFHCQWQDLKDLFRQAGAVLRADVALGPDGRSRGFGTVSFSNDVDTERALNMFNGYDYNGRTLKVHYDKYSQGQPQSPLPQNALASPSPTTLHHSHSTPPTHISMPVPPSMSAFEHLMSGHGHHPPSPYDHPFGQLSPYDFYSHMPSGAGNMSSPRYMTTSGNHNHTQSPLGPNDYASPASATASNTWSTGPLGQINTGSFPEPVSASSNSTFSPLKQKSETPPSGESSSTLPALPGSTSGFASSGTTPADITASTTTVANTLPNRSATTTTTTTTSPTTERKAPAPSLQHHQAHPGPISLPSPPLHPFPNVGPISPLAGLPPITPSMPTFTFVPQNATPPLNAHFLSPGVMPTPFSPPMSPGAFYHPPGNQRYHMQWNVAPGAPIHMSSPMGSPNMYPPYNHGGEMQMPSGGMDYFSVPPPPPSRVTEGYFPPVANLPRSSGLANEIKQDSESPGSRDEMQGGAERSTSDGSVATSGVTASASEISTLSDLESGSIAQQDMDSAKLRRVEDSMARLILSDEIRTKPLMGEVSPAHPEPQRTQSDMLPVIEVEVLPRPTVVRDAISTPDVLSAGISANMMPKMPWRPLHAEQGMEYGHHETLGAQERRASWTPELTRKDFRKGIIGGTKEGA